MEERARGRARAGVLSGAVAHGGSTGSAQEKRAPVSAQSRREAKFVLALLDALPPGALDSDEALNAALSNPDIARLWAVHAPGLRRADTAP